MAERRVVNREMLYRAAGFDPATTACHQADVVDRLFPDGFDVDAKPAEAMAGFAAAKAKGLNVVYVACLLALQPALDSFVQLTIDQRVRVLGLPDQDAAGQAMADEPTERTDRYRLASSILRDTGLGLNNLRAYYAAVSAQKGARALKGKGEEKVVKDEQADFFFEVLRQLRDKEIPTVHELEQMQREEL